MPEESQQIHVLPSAPTNVACILFASTTDPQVLLVHWPRGKTPFYDVPSAPYDFDPNDSFCVQRAASDLILEGTGIGVPLDQWEEIITLRLPTAEITFLTAHVPRLLVPTGDGLSLEQPDALPINTVHTLKWLIPLALDTGVVKPLGLQGV
jgi:hypothetical protein